MDGADEASFASFTGCQSDNGSLDKTALLVYKCICSLAPSYLAASCQPLAVPSRDPPICIQLHAARTRTTVTRASLSMVLLCVSRAFRFSAPRIWNKLPLRIRETQSLPALKRHLKTHFFQSAYPTP